MSTYFGSNSSLKNDNDSNIPDLESPDTISSSPTSQRRLPRPLGMMYDESGSSINNNSSEDILPSSPSPATVESTPHLPDILEGQDSQLRDEDEILDDDSISAEEKSRGLQQILFIASSNGDVDRVHQLLGGKARDFINIDAKDDTGSTALIYSSCFGNGSIVNELLRYGASPDEQDKHEWTALMWAINNHHTSIVKYLLENGSAINIRTSTGRTAVDFVSKNSEIYNYMKNYGYIDPDEPDDFYDDGKDPNQYPDSNNDFSQHQIMMESAANLDVDMSRLGINDAADSNEKYFNLEGDQFNNGGFFYGEEGENDDADDDQPEFVWDKVLPDQMFVFNESDIPKILDESITKMVPQRSHSQKPIPANMIFLCSRYAHNFGNEETLDNFLNPVLSRIRSVVKENREDVAYMAFWLSNLTLLMYYFRKDASLFPATVPFQEKLSELITDVYVWITQDVERRMDKVLDSSVLDHETIPGMDDIHYQSDWRIFRHKKQALTHKQEVEQVTRPPSPKKKAQPSPRNITSILSSVLFVMDLYDVHPIVTQQIISQLLYWLGTVLFNRIMSNRKYLARSRAMQIRLNVSALEDWARANNRRPEDPDDEFGDGDRKKKHANLSISELCTKHFSPLVQILQWLQTFTGFGDDFTNVIATLQQLTALNPSQLLHVANKYRAEVGEKGLSKEYKNYLSQLNMHYKKQAAGEEKPKQQTSEDKKEKQEDTATEKEGSAKDETPSSKGKEEEVVEEQQPQEKDIEEPYPKRVDELFFDASVVLPFIIPTLREMIITWGAGLGGTHAKRARRYEPNLPTEFLDKFDSEENNYDEDEPKPQNKAVDDPLFRDVAMPQPSVHKAWGDSELDLEEMSSNVW